MRLIANPAAGGGSVGRDWDAIVDELRGVFPDLQAVRTERTGHGTDLATQAVADGHTEILSLGGDGTHSEVAAGIAAAESDTAISLGILHGGTGGDFSRLLGRGSFREQATRLRDRPARPIDLGRATWEGGERVFLNEISVGMSAAICASVNTSRKLLGGTVTFLTHTLKVLVRYRPQAIEIVVDGEQTLRPGPIQTAILCNGQWAGGGMHFSPRARLSDGKLDLTVIRDAPTLKALRLTPHLYNGKILDQPQVDWARGEHFSIRSLGEPLYVEADGEVVCQTPLEVQILPGALLLMGAPEDVL